MNILLYLFIFILKILENMIATLRIIIINNNKKILGALLQFTGTMIWILGTSLVIVDITKDIFKIFIFAFGSAVGSYLGSKIEEKLALGTNLIICISRYDLSFKIRSYNYDVTVLSSNGINKSIFTHLIVTPRYKASNLINLIKELDDNALITLESTSLINGGYK